MDDDDQYSPVRQGKGHLVSPRVVEGCDRRRGLCRIQRMDATVVSRVREIVVAAYEEYEAFGEEGGRAMAAKYRRCGRLAPWCISNSNNYFKYFQGRKKQQGNEQQSFSPNPDCILISVVCNFPGQQSSGYKQKVLLRTSDYFCHPFSLANKMRTKPDAVR